MINYLNSIKPPPIKYLYPILINNLVLKYIVKLKN
jgi:hypothetical protein